MLGPDLWYQGAAAALIALAQAARDHGPHTIAFHDDAMDLMHVADTARALVATMEATSLPSPIYNINGFTARASDLVRAIAVKRPRLVLKHDVQPSAMPFPLISDAAFRQALSFTPDHRTPETFVTAMLTQDPR